MLPRFGKIFEPVNINGLEIRNRIAMAPMAVVGLLDSDGSLSQRAVDYYIERVRGGVGLIITSNFKVENEVERFKGNIFLVSPDALASFSELAEAVHAHGSQIFVQITAGMGRVINPRRLLAAPVCASPVPYYWDPSITCRELSVAEVEKLVAAFGRAAGILAKAGIDGVDLHGHEGYLFDQFASAAWNKRTDKYGGDLQGRLRLATEVLQEIKRSAGSDFIVQYRFGLKHFMKGPDQAALPGEEFVEAGRDVPEGLAMAKMLEEAGYDSLHVDAGCYDSWYWAHPPTYHADACLADMAAQVKKVVNIPVIAVGKLDDPVLAEQILDEGKADMVALGRALLSDAQWVRKVREKRVEEIRPCIGCFEGCMKRLYGGKPLSCAVNPETGRERLYALQRAPKAKKVVIAGGGVAGLEAARVAALRGHKVILYEKGRQLGGSLIPGSVPAFKESHKRLLDWYCAQVRTGDVEINMECPADSELIQSQEANVVIAATGARPYLPELPGMDHDKVATASQVLMGQKSVGPQAVVVGGGLVACETALWLAQKGIKTTIVVRRPELMTGRRTVFHATRKMLLDLLAFHKVQVMAGTQLTGVNHDGLKALNASGKEITVAADTVVMALGWVPDQGLYRSLLGTDLEIYQIGDARQVRNIMGAVWDAYEVARGV